MPPNQATFWKKRWRDYRETSPSRRRRRQADGGPLKRWNRMATDFARHADRVCVLDGGRMVEEGAAFEILGRPRHDETRVPSMRHRNTQEPDRYRFAGRAVTNAHEPERIAP